MIEDERGPSMGYHTHRIEVDAEFIAKNDTLAEAAVEAFKELAIFGQRLTFTAGPSRTATVGCVGGCENVPDL